MYGISYANHRKIPIDAVFATTGKNYINSDYMLGYSDKGIRIIKKPRNALPGKGVENKMTDNLKVKASKVVDDARVAAHAAVDDATVVAHNALKDAGVKAQNVSDDVKIGVHKAVADAKIAAHSAGSELKKK